MKKQSPLREKQLRTKITEGLIAHLLIEGQLPNSVAQLCKKLKIKEPAFYLEFASLESVKKAIWKEWIDSLISAVTSGAEWQSFSAKERYLAFLFTFSQAALERRSLLLISFSTCTQLENPSALDGLKTSFTAFAKELIEHGKESGEIANRGALTGFYPELLYLHWRWTLDFYLKDESEGFERTDAFIEKTVGLAFDLFRSQAIDSAAELARFLLPKSSYFKSMGGS